MVRSTPANAGDLRDVGSIPGLGRSPGVEHGNPLQDSCLENPMDRGAWRATVHGVPELDTTEATQCARTRTHTHTQNTLLYICAASSLAIHLLMSI